MRELLRWFETINLKDGESLILDILLKWVGREPRLVIVFYVHVPGLRFVYKYVIGSIMSKELVWSIMSDVPH